MKKKILFLLTILLTPFIINAEELKMEWQQNMGDISNEFFSSVMVTNSNEYYVFLSSNTYDYTNDINDVLAKYDKDGNLLWQKNWIENYNQTFKGGFVTHDNGIIIYGNTYSSNIENMENKGKKDAFIIKYDKDGNIVWKHSWGGSDDETFNGGTLTGNNEIIMYGNTTSTDIEGLANKGSDDAIILKYDKDGNLLWQKSWGGNDEDIFENILQTKDEEYVLYGITASTDIDGLKNEGGEDIIVVKYDKEGNVIWQKIYGSKHYENISSFAIDDDGNIVMVGNFYADVMGSIVNFNSGTYDGFIIKIDKDGNKIWEKGFGGTNGDSLNSIIFTMNGEILVSAQFNSKDIAEIGPHNAKNAAALLKYDKNGNLIWYKIYSESQEQRISKMIYTNNRIIIGVESFSSGEGEVFHWGEEDAMLMMYEENGNLVQKIKLTGNSSDGFFDIAYNSSNEIICAGYSSSTDLEGIENKGEEDGIIVKYSHKYDLEINSKENGNAIIEQQDSLGIVKPSANKGYEVDKIIVKDKNGDVLDVEITKLEDGTYSFPLYTDVSVEVLFKEVLSNPKTGVFDYISFILIGLLISFIGYNVINYNNQKFEL